MTSQRLSLPAMKPTRRHTFAHDWALAAVLLLLLTVGAREALARLQDQSHAQVVIVVDGLRPDEVNAATMPRLTRLGRRGVVFNAHHSVFPTVTRVNSSSMVTGVYPEGHGLLGNTIYIASVDPARGLDTGVHTNLEAVARVSGRAL